MGLEEAVQAVLDVRAGFRSRQAIDDPNYLSERMIKLAIATAAVEEHLAALEEGLELSEHERYQYYTTSADTVLSPSAAERQAKDDVAELRGKIKKLTRFVNSSWKLTEKAQSRWNHLNREFGLGGKVT
jgi:hypothetical protein